MFTHTFVLVAVTSFTHCYLSALITPHWKVLRSLNLHHSAPLEMLFLMKSFVAKVKDFIFRPKTMDYSKAFWPKLSSFFVVLLLRNGRCYIQSCNLDHSAPLYMHCCMEPFPAKVKISISRLKTMDYSPWFDFWESESELVKRIPPERAPQGEQNDANFSSVAPCIRSYECPNC